LTCQAYLIPALPFKPGLENERKCTTAITVPQSGGGRGGGEGGGRGVGGEVEGGRKREAKSQVQTVAVGKYFP